MQHSQQTDNGILQKECIPQKRKKEEEEEEDKEENTMHTVFGIGMLFSELMGILIRMLLRARRVKFILKKQTQTCNTTRY